MHKRKLNAEAVHAFKADPEKDRVDNEKAEKVANAKKYELMRIRSARSILSRWGKAWEQPDNESLAAYVKLFNNLKKINNNVYGFISLMFKFNYDLHSLVYRHGDGEIKEMWPWQPLTPDWPEDVKAVATVFDAVPYEPDYGISLGWDRGRFVLVDKVWPNPLSKDERRKRDQALREQLAKMEIIDLGNELPF